MSEFEEPIAPMDGLREPKDGGLKIVPSEANYWWRKNEPVGALFNGLMFLFIVVPIGLVIKRFYLVSFIVFAFMVPYGFFVRYLAVRAVRHHLANHPEARDEFEQDGIIKLRIADFGFRN